MASRIERARPAWLQALITVLFLLAFVFAYAALMQATAGRLRTDGGTVTADSRDTAYLALHLGLLLLAAVAGFALGKWMCGLPLAFTVLFVAVLAVAMLGLQLGSFAAACNGGHNDILRHWTCQR